MKKISDKSDKDKEKSNQVNKMENNGLDFYLKEVLEMVSTNSKSINEEKYFKKEIILPENEINFKKENATRKNNKEKYVNEISFEKCSKNDLNNSKFEKHENKKIKEYKVNKFEDDKEDEFNKKHILENSEKNKNVKTPFIFDDADYEEYYKDEDKIFQIINEKSNDDKTSLSNLKLNDSKNITDSGECKNLEDLEEIFELFIKKTYNNDKGILSLFKQINIFKKIISLISFQTFEFLIKLSKLNFNEANLAFNKLQDKLQKEKNLVLQSIMSEQYTNNYTPKEIGLLLEGIIDKIVINEVYGINQNEEILPFLTRKKYSYHLSFADDYNCGLEFENHKFFIIKLFNDKEYFKASIELDKLETNSKKLNEKKNGNLLKNLKDFIIL